MHFSSHRFAIQLLLPGLAAVFLLAGCHQPKPAPGIDGLSDALKRSAEKDLAAPSLANEVITLSARPAEMEARTKEVLDASGAAGGTAIRTVQDGVVTILARIPEHNAAIFRGLLRHEKTTPGKPESPGEMLLMEVLIKPSSTAPEASPTPP